MTRDTQRIPPLPEAEWTGEAAELLERARQEGPGGEGVILNIFRTFARHHKLWKRWSVFGNHVLNKSTLPPRDREILILRTAWLSRSEYEWGQHVLIARQEGFTKDEIARVTEGPAAPGWLPFEATLLRSVDELLSESKIGDETWSELARRYSTQQLMDVVFTVGHYSLVAMALNSFGVQRDEGVPGFAVAAFPGSSSEPQRGTPS